MAYILTEEQQFLKDSARDLLKSAPVALVRELRDNNNPLGYSTELWGQMVEMGWPTLGVSEEFGGLNFGIRGFGIIAEEMGRTLSNSPLLSMAIATYILAEYGNQDQKNELKHTIEEGKIWAITLQEGLHFRPSQPQLTAHNEEGYWILNGVKTLVADAHVADKMMVSAHTDKGLCLFVLNTDTVGIQVEKEIFMDSRYYSEVSFKSVKVSESNILGEASNSEMVLADIINVANVLISAELLGLMSEAFERTIMYLKERRQFDRVIGSFQGLQHRAANMYSELEVAKSLVIKALDSIDANDFMAPALCSMAKAKTAVLSQIVTNEGIQMYGGIGMTDDEEIGFFMKRARVAAQLYGGSSYHLDRFATMSGY